MKKLYAAICLTSALLLSGCKFFLNQNDDETNKKTPDPKPTFEYTANNDVPASKVPFDKKLCYEPATSLELSDGEWTVQKIVHYPDTAVIKAISKGEAKDNKLTFSSAMHKIDLSAETEESDDEEPQPATNEQFEELFTSFMTELTPFKGVPDYMTFSNGYVTEDNRVVFIVNSNTETMTENFKNVQEMKSFTVNPNKTKYVIQESETSTIYIYKDANLNDKETIPENPPADDDDDKVDLTDIVKELDYSECKTTLNLSELSFADGDWEIVVDETLHIGIQRAINKASVKNNKLNFSEGKAFVISELSYYSDYNDKENMFKFDLSFLGFTAKQVLMDKNYIVADLGGLTDSGLTAEEELLSTSNLSKQSNLTIKTNDNKSKYNLSFGNMQNGMYTVYFNKAGGAESQEPSEGQNESGNQGESEEQENPLTKLYNSDNDVPAAKVPFNAKLCPQNGKALSLSNGKWKIVDIALGKDWNRNYDFETITDVTFTDGEYNCTSSISKYDFDKNSANEVFDYEGVFKSHSGNPYIKTFSHGYSTNSKHVIITKNEPKIFDQVYLSQLNTLPTDAVYSNASGTKYIIPFMGYSYPQTIYIYKENTEEDLGYIAPTLPENVGTDPFAGKTFGTTDEKYEFGTDNTIIYYRNISLNPADPDVRAAFKYQYTYNASTKLLTYSCILMMNRLTEELGSFNEIKDSLPDLIYGASNPEELYNYYLSSMQELFENPKIWKAELSAGKLSLYDQYYTEVPDLTKTNLQLRNSFNNTTVEILVTQYDKSTITIVIPVDYTDDNGVLHSNSSSIKTEYEITSLTENTITAIEKEKMKRNNEENGDYYSVVNPNPATITIEYKNARIEDGIICIDISGKDDITKEALGADAETPDPSYTVISTNDHPHTYPLMS